MQSSLFLFQFRLSPWDACVNLNFANLGLIPEQFHAVCTRDLLGLQTSTIPENFMAVHSLAQALVASLIDAHSYFAYPNLPALDLSPINFFEVKDSGPKSTVFGYNDPSLLHAPLQAGHDDNKPFVEATKLVSHTLNTAGLGAALSDFRTARRDIGPYSAFYAFRALEDIGYSFGKSGDDKPNWEAMNDAFGTNEDYWKPLTDAGEQARHLEPNSQITLKLIQNRTNILNLSKDALKRWLKFLKL